MRFLRLLSVGIVFVPGLGIPLLVGAQSSAASPSSHPSSTQNPSSHIKPQAESGLEAGNLVNGVYRNKTLGLSFKIPVGWVLRTDEMNKKQEPDSARDGNSKAESSKASQNREGTARPAGDDSKVLLAVFSRPPEARGDDVNASVVIAAESVEAYPGLKEAAQYFGPLTEVAQAQGFTVDEEPYEYEVGPKKLVRGDFHKDVGTRVMRQSTLAWLARGYAVSITVIGGSEDDVEGLVDALTFGGTK